MPAVFLSYARQDLTLARRMEEDLAAAGVRVWRDQEGLRAGESWPKALGEAVAASDALVLLWSRHAAESRFVESEWNTALALKKKVLPCLLDDTPLPAALAAIQAVALSETEVAGSARSIAGALAPVTLPADSSFTFSRKRATIAIAAGILIAGMYGIVMRMKAPAANQEQTIAGSITEEPGTEPIPGVRVSVLLGDQVAANGVTNELGHYGFHIAGAPEADITLLAQKEGYRTEKRYAHLGSPGFDFKMQRKP